MVWSISTFQIMTMKPIFDLCLLNCTSRLWYSGQKESFLYCQIFSLLLVCLSISFDRFRQWWWECMHSRYCQIRTLCFGTWSMKTFAHFVWSAWYLSLKMSRQGLLLIIVHFLTFITTDIYGKTNTLQTLWNNQLYRRVVIAIVQYFVHSDSFVLLLCCIFLDVSLKAFQYHIICAHINQTIFFISLQ